MKCTTSLQIKSNITFSHSWKFWWWSAQNCSILVPLFSPWDHLCVIMIHSVKWCLCYSKAQRPLLVIISCYPLHKRAGCGEMLYFSCCHELYSAACNKSNLKYFRAITKIFSIFHTTTRLDTLVEKMLTVQSELLLVVWVSDRKKNKESIKTRSTQ